MEHLEEKTVYQAVAKVQYRAGGQVSVGLKPTGLDASFDDGRVLHYDLEGRMARVATPNVHWRRGLSHRTVWLRKRSAAEGGGLEVRRLDRAESDRLVDEASRRMRQVQEAWTERRFTLQRNDLASDPACQQLERMIAAAAGFDAAAARADLARFESLYGDIPILPPDQYGSLVLLATEGCAYDQCTFCGFYRGTRFRRRSVDEFRQHLEQAVAYHGQTLRSRRGIFLGQANALVGPESWQEDILRTVNGYFEFPAFGKDRPSPRWWQGSTRRMDGISCFLDAFTGVRTEPRQFAALRRLHLSRLYLGVETGDPELLAWLRKPAGTEQMLETVMHAKLGGLRIGVILLIGAGGESFFDSHVGHTVRLLNAMPLGRGDFIYLSPLVNLPGTEYSRLARAEGVTPLTAERMMAQEQQIRGGLDFESQRDRPYVAHYDVSHFVY